MPNNRKNNFSKTCFILDSFSFGPFNLYTTLSWKDLSFKEEETEVWAGAATCYHHIQIGT